MTRTDSFSAIVPTEITKNVWSEFGGLAVQHSAINLGQGYPDWNPPTFVTDALIQSTQHQYTRPAGHLPLVKLLAEKYSRHLQREVHAEKEVAITVGASQALYLALVTLLKENEEVVMFEPFFELYLKQIALTKAKPVFVSLTLEDDKQGWGIDFAALERAITPKTKVLILNSPHNPTGKVFTLDEMMRIADIVRKHPNLVIISDEVYKFTIYNNAYPGDSTAIGHYHFARLPAMWDRTITLSSCGKTFSVTGWQVGWMVGPKRLIEPAQRLLPCVQFCAATPIQEALVKAITIAEQPYNEHDTYYQWLRAQFAKKRQILEGGLRAAGLQPIASEGGFFLMARLPIIDLQDKANVDNDPYDWRYCRYLAQERRVIGIPASPFFSRADYHIQQSNVGPLARFAFCKVDETILEAVQRLEADSKVVRSSYPSSILVG